MPDSFRQRYFGDNTGQFASAEPMELSAPNSKSLRDTMTAASKLAPGGLPWQSWRPSTNVEVAPGDAATNILKMFMQKDALDRKILGLNAQEDTSMMLPTVPQLNPMAMFNRPAGPTLPGGPPPTGLGTPFSQQLLTLLGGLGGMPNIPLAPGIARSPQPGPPPNTATQILGALGATKS